MSRPRIAITLADPARARDKAAARLKNELYLDTVRRADGEPVGLDATTAERLAAEIVARADGVLLSGGADLDPALYGEAPDGTVGVRRDRDRLDLAAWRAAGERRAPVLGICRGLQAINVFMGGRLIQHVDGHQGPSFGEGDPVIHRFTLVPGSRLARIVDREGGDGAHADGITASGPVSFAVNSYHHQAVRPPDLAPGLVAAGFADDGDRGPLVEALESADDRWIVGVQFHPERVETTPPAFERLFAAFVAAADESPSHRD